MSPLNKFHHAIVAEEMKLNGLNGDRNKQYRMVWRNTMAISLRKIWGFSLHVVVDGGIGGHSS